MSMLDRQKIESILACRFPGTSHAQRAAATNAIMGLDDEWEEVSDAPAVRRPQDWFEVHDAEFRLFRRREC